MGFATESVGPVRKSRASSSDAQAFFILKVLLARLSLSGADDAVKATGVCCFYYRSCRSRRPLLQPVQHNVKFCTHKKYNENRVRNNPSSRLFMIPTLPLRTQSLSFFLLTHSLTKRNNVVSSCANGCTGKFSTELI